MPKSEILRAELDARFARAEAAGMTFIEVVAGELHRALADDPAPDHHMPKCSAVMRAAMRGGDAIVHAPSSGQEASLRIRYILPR